MKRLVTIDRAHGVLNEDVIVLVNEIASCYRSISIGEDRVAGDEIVYCYQINSFDFNVSE